MFPFLFYYLEVQSLKSNSVVLHGSLGDWCGVLDLVLLAELLVLRLKDLEVDVVLMELGNFTART